MLEYRPFPAMRCGGTAKEKRCKCSLLWVKIWWVFLSRGWERVAVIAGDQTGWYPTWSLWLVAGWRGTGVLRSLGGGGTSLGRGIYLGWAGCSHAERLVVSVAEQRGVVLGLLALLVRRDHIFSRCLLQHLFDPLESIWPKSFIFLQRRVPTPCCGCLWVHPVGSCSRGG